MHPLAPDLSSLSETVLHQKHGELVKRINQCYRTGSTGVVGQLQMLLQNYTEEIQVRNRKMLEELAKSNKNFDGTIDIS